MIAVDEVDVGPSRRTEQDCVAQSTSGGGVSRWVILPEVGFDLHDTGGQNLATFPADEDLSKKVASDAPGIAIVEAGG